MSLHSYVDNFPTDVARVYFGNAAPTAPDGNSYALGDRIRNAAFPTASALAPGTPVEWVCILSGVGGVAQWIELGAGQAVGNASLSNSAGLFQVIQADSGAMLHFTIPFSSLPAGASPVTVSLFTPPSKTIVYGVVIKPSTSFTGGGLSAMTMGVGTAGSANLYSNSAFNVFQAVANTTFLAFGGFTVDNWIIPGAVVATFTSTGANPNAATAGSVDVFVWVKTARV